MSGWGGLFGNKPKPLGQELLEKMSTGGSDPDDEPKDGKAKDNSKKTRSAMGFDSTGLERAAQAAKVLDKSPNASNILDLIHQQEATKAEEHKSKAAHNEAVARQLEMQRVQAEAEEARKTLDQQTQHERHRADYTDQLARKRHVEGLQQERQIREEEMKRQEQLTERQEQIKRETLKYEADLRRKTELARVSAETEGKIRQERENHDLRLDEARVNAGEYRSTVLQAIGLAGETLGTGIRGFLEDPNKMLNATSTLTAVAVGVYTAKVGTGVAGRYIEARLGKPSLVRETSRQPLKETLKHPIVWAKRKIGMRKAQDALKGVILEPTLEKRLQRVANSTANTKRNKAPFRHLLLYGPPGTGKTLFAKGLARHSGLEYAIMTGGDIAPLGRDAVTEMHKLFDWAQTSRHGLLLFVDEADAFLRRRSTEHISEDLRNALNAFLYRTGEATDKFMLVYASNQPEQFDWAVNDRIDEMVPFNLPGREERLRMIIHYVDKYLRTAKGNARPIAVDSLREEHITAAADRTEGFSGREIAKLAIAWQAAAYGSVDTSFTPELMEEVLTAHLQQKQQKQEWLRRAGQRPQKFPPRPKLITNTDAERMVAGSPPPVVLQ